MHGIADYDPLMSGLGMHRGSVLHLELASSAPRNENADLDANGIEVIQELLCQPGSSSPPSA